MTNVLSRAMKDINQLLDHQKLHNLIHHAASLRKLDAVLEAILPPAIKGHVHSARLEDQTLTLITSNASYATQVRFSSSALLAALNEQMPPDESPVIARLYASLRRLYFASTSARTSSRKKRA